jgi:exodeoxyribonuclease VII small subunit
MSEPCHDDAGKPISFEQALASLEQVVHDLEDGQIGLAESLARYESGIKLLKHCYGLLEGAERKIELLTGVDADGNPILEAFDAQSSLERSEKGTAGNRRRAAKAQTSPLPNAVDRVAGEPSREIAELESGMDDARGLF